MKKRGRKSFQNVFLAALSLLLSGILVYSITFISTPLVLALGLNNNSNWSNELDGAVHSSLALGDVNNDGRLDLVSGGCLVGGVDTCSSSDIVRVYLNNGTGFAENQTWQQNLTNLCFGSLALGDIDRDGDLDLVRTGNINTSYGFVKVYLNNGSSFEENVSWQQNFTSINNAFGSSVALGDIDNDGDLDIALIGTDSTVRNGIYLNNGTAFERNSTWLASMPLAGYGGGNGAVAFGDIDNDGYLDLVMAGSRYTNWYRAVYINNGTSLVENSTWESYYNPIFGWPSLTLGDYDNDRDLDLMAIGARAGDHYYIYENTGTTFLTNESETSKGSCCLAGYYAGSLHMGDYDTDGYLDSVVMGRETRRDWVYRNYYTNTSQNPYNVVFYGDGNASKDIYRDDLQRGSLAWSDLDNDTHLDAVIIGVKASSGILLSLVYISDHTVNNTFPQPPNLSFSENYVNDKLTLSWGNGSDNETPTAGLYYNLRVGNCSGCHNIVSGIFGGSSNPTAGYFGNMMQRKSITLSGDWLQANTTYYWSVQTIDTGLAKSAWSEEQNYSTAEQEIISPEIVLNEPAGSNYTSFDNITFNATVWDNVNVSNVSLYGSWDGWHRNQTNSSGQNGTDYLFQVNLSGYPEGTYTWGIHSCDTSGNCRYSENRTVIRDLLAPLVMLEYPANESTWTASNTLNFTFNVTDLAIQNCSLIIGSSLKYNLTSVVVNTSTNITLDLANGNYLWYVNCTDMLLRRNSSARRQLTVNYQVYSPPSVPSGGGGGGIPSKTYEIGKFQEAQEINKALRKGDKITFSVKEEEHKLEVKKVLSQSVVIEINSTLFNFTLGINESKKLNLSSFDFYDLFVKLNSVINFKANLTLRAIHEAIPFVKPPEEENATKEEIEKEEKPVKTDKEERSYWWIGSGLASIAVIAGLITWFRKKKAIHNTTPEG